MTRPPTIRAAFDGPLFPGELVIERDAGRFVAGQSYSPATQFKPGERVSPATEIKSGQRLSVATEFKPGQAARNKLPLGAVRIRIENGTGRHRAWVKIAEPNRWRKRAIVAWEAVNGPLPRGRVVHHRDRNSLNDDLSNLVALTRSEHTAEHRRELLMGAVRALAAAEGGA